MAKDVVLEVESRKVSGSSEVNKLRRQGILPGVINEAGAASKLIQLKEHDMEMLLKKHTSENLVLDVSIDGEKTQKVLLHEVQHNAVTEQIMHVEFLSVSMDKKMKVSVVLELVGEAKGVKLGGILEHNLREVDVECLPSDIMEFIEVDVTDLDIGDTLKVSDIKLKEGVSILNDKDIVIAAVAAPKVEADSADGDESQAGEPEVIGKKLESEEK